MLLLAMRVPTEYWVHLLTPFRGALPSTDAEYRQFIEYVRRFGHLAEAGNYSIAQGVTQGHPTMWATPGEAAHNIPNSGTESAAYLGVAGCGAQSPANPGAISGMFPTGPSPGPLPPQYDDDSDTSDDDEGQYLAEDVDEPDMTGWTTNQVGEYFYQKYKHYTRKWRRFTRRAPKRQRGPTRRRSFMTDDGAHVSTTEAFYGKGGGKGRHRKGNPMGVMGSL